MTSNTEIGAIVYGMIPNISESLSGILTTIVNQQIYFVEEFTGDTISVDNIDNKYQPPIVNLTAANIMELMQSQGMGTKSVSIGELSISKGMSESSSTALKNDAMDKLRVLGQKTSFYHSYAY